MYILRGDKLFLGNEEFKRYLGYRDETEMHAISALEFVHPDDRALVASGRSRPREEMQPYEYRFIDRRGNEKWVLEKTSPVDFLSLGGEASYIACTIVDITDRKLAEEQLKEALSLYAATIESTGDGIVVVDMDHHIRQMNRQYRSMWSLPDKIAQPGMPTEPVVKQILKQVVDGDVFGDWVNSVRFSEKEDATRAVELKDGRVFEAHARPQLMDGVVVGRIWSYRDVTERRSFESTLMRMANYDALTGLLNRRRFQEEAEQSLEELRERGGRAALILLDADRFKDVNDSLGHQAGDEILVQLASILRSTFPRRLVGRYGGEEFGVFLPNTSVRAAKDAGARFIAALNKRTLSASGSHLRITVSGGLAMFPEHGESLRDLFSRADMALYDAKFAGRDRISVYSGQAREQAEQLRQNWRDKFHDALRNRRLMLYGQPVMTTTGGLRGYEMLIRLRDANGTLLPAKHFIPAAEQMGLLRRIDEWVVVETLQLLKEIQDRGYEFRLGMNLGGWAFSDHRMLDFLEGAFADSGVDPSGLLVEMTEMSAVSDISRAVKFITALQSMGCSFALDDFGVGYSSFDYLKRLPVDVLKIDGSFIRDLTHSHTSREIVAAMISVAKGLKIVTVAESVQDEETFNLVRDMGVDNVQGYWVGRPRPIAKILQPASLRPLRIRDIKKAA